MKRIDITILDLDDAKVEWLFGILLDLIVLLGGRACGGLSEADNEKEA